MSTEMRVLQEVLDTETVYVEDLNEVIQVSVIISKSLSNRFNNSTVMLSSITLINCKIRYLFL